MCPPQFKEVMTSRPDSVQAFFDLWIGNEQCWGKVEVYVRKYMRNFNRGEATKRWLTEAQLKDHFHDDDVAADVMKASPSRQNPAAPQCAKAKQYQVTIWEDDVKGMETGDETGIAGHGELNQKNCKDGKLKAVLDMIGDSSSSSVGGGGGGLSEEERLRLEQEKQAKADERAKKQREAARKLAKNPKLRMEKWLKGINNDLSKISTALVEVKRCKDSGQRQLFSERFTSSQSALKEFRGKFEKALVKGGGDMDKATVEQADAKVLEA